MKKSLTLIASAAALLGAFAAPAFAASTFHLVVPLAARTQAQEPVEAITVSLAGAALPKATVNQTYSESLRNYLSVTGDSAFDPAAARWSVAEGNLPAGLSLDEATGAVAGSPTAKTTSPASFTVLASYKGADGQAVYTIEVGGETLNVSKIASGGNHTCAITDAGVVKCWGSNSQGQLGNNTSSDSQVPVTVVGFNSAIRSISLSAENTCAVTTSGAAACWGDNYYGQLGDNTKTDRRTPVGVAGLGAGVETISAGARHSCALMTSGDVKCWGNNSFGQLGDNSTTDRLTPVAVVGMNSAVASIAVGKYHTCVMTTSGVAKCWGYNAQGQLGDNSTTKRLTPVDAVGVEVGSASITAGGDSTCVTTTTGAAKCWGLNTSGQLGDGSTINRLTPVDVVGLESGVASIAVGESHTCAVTTLGAAKCWGSGSFLQLGHGSSANRPLPSDVVGLATGVMSISVGRYHSCAMTTSGGVKCWGDNNWGQLGDNSRTKRQTPVDVQGFQ